MVQGVVLKDLLPHPETDPTVHEGKATTIVDAPTESHELLSKQQKASTPTMAQVEPKRPMVRKCST